MSTPFKPRENPTTSMINLEDVAETSRLIEIDHLYTKAMGSLFPPDFTPLPGRIILDIACGPGGWVLDVARAHPNTDVIGVDISQKMISYAQTQAGMLGLHQASFQVMDMLKPLEFPESAFEFVNMRFIAGSLHKEHWSPLLQECLRVVQLGGVIRVTESEWWFTNSPAVEKLTGWTIRAMWQDDRTFDPAGRLIGTPMMLPSLIREAKIAIQQQAHTLEFSYGTEAYEAIYPTVMMTYQLMRPFLLKTGMTSEEEFDRVFEQATIEIQTSDFKGSSFFLSVWGRKLDQ
jgi:SAM-dependent methyltransferase